MQKLMAFILGVVFMIAGSGLSTPAMAEGEDDFTWFDVFTTRKAAEDKVIFHMYSYVEYFDAQGGPLDGNAQFRQHVFEPFFGYTVNDKVFVKGIIEFEDIGGTATNEKIQVEQAEIDITPWPNTTIGAGAILVPFGLENYKHAPSDNPFVTRPRAFKDGGMFPNTWTDAGVQIMQTVPGLGYLDLYYINGDARNGRRAREDKTLAGKADGNNGKSVGVELQVAEVVKGLNFGASYVTGPWGTYFNTVSASSSTVDSNRWGVHAEYAGVHGVPLQLAAEYVAGTDERDSSVSVGGLKNDKDVAGYYLTAGFDPVTNLTVLARLGAWDNDKDKADNNKTEQTYGLRWKMYPGTYLKGEYRVTKNKPTDTKDNQVAFQLSATF